MAEKMNMEEFFERARKGEFLGAKVTMVLEPIVFTVKESDEDPLVGGWYVADEPSGIGVYEGYNEDVDYLIVESGA